MGSGAFAVASLMETWGMLSRFDCVYSDYITQGCPGGALAVAMSLRARCFFFHTHYRTSVKGPQGVICWVGGGITRGGAEIALAFCLCVFRLHESRGGRECSDGLL